MHKLIVVTICICLSISTLAVKIPSKYSTADEISSTTKDDGNIETVTIGSKDDGHIVPEPEDIQNKASLIESVSTVMDEDINIEDTSSAVPDVESTTISQTLSSDVPKKGSRVLFFAPVVGYSHSLDYLGVAETLASNGHQVTMVSGKGFNKPYLHREVVLPMRDINKMIPNLWGGRASGLGIIFEWVPLCLEALATQEVQDIKKEEFDLIILAAVFSECFLSVIHEMEIPYAYIFPNALGGGLMYGNAGNPLFLSFTPSQMFGITSPPDGLPFIERAKGIGMDLMFYAMSNYMVSSMDKECRAQGLCSQDLPYLADLALNSSIYIVIGNRNMDPVGQPIVQSVVYAGGIHLKTAQPLTTELEQWVQSSGDAGFIYISFGSLVKASEMPEEYRQVLIQAFSSLDQKVLWKWDEESMADQPDNVRLNKWLPQQDLLGHSKLRLFITHGGLHSITEAMHSGVPVLGMPLAGDQHSNMAQAQSRGWGKPINWNNLTVDALVKDIHEVINSHSMKKEAMRLSKLMKDQIISPKDNVNYWVEYVIRHKGAYHLKCPATYMPWYRLYNADVWLTLILILTLILYLGYLVLGACWRCCRSRKHKTE